MAGDECSDSSEINTFISGSVFLLSAMITTWWWYQYIRLETLHKSSNKCLHYSPLAYFGTISIYLWVAAFALFVRCSSFSLYNLASAVTLLLGGQQYILLLSMFYVRLNYYFNDTSLRLSNCTKRVYYVLFAIQTVVSLAVVAVWFTGDWELTGALVGLSYFVGIVMHISMVILFVSKLKTVHRNVADNLEDTRMIGVVNKLTLLTIISVVSSLVFIATVALIGADGSDPSVIRYPVLWTLALVNDYVTNFLSLLWGYSAFETSYQKFCGCCDQKCTDKYRRQFGGKDADASQVGSTSLQTVGSGSVITGDSSGITIAGAGSSELSKVDSVTPATAEVSTVEP